MAPKMTFDLFTPSERAHLDMALFDMFNCCDATLPLLQVAAIGGTTGDSLSKAGSSPDVIAREPNSDSLARVILQSCS